MKRIIISLMMALAICATSCKKFLDTKPTDFVVPEQYYNNEQQLNEALAGVYSSLAETGTYGLSLSFNDVIGNDEGFYKNTTPNPFPANYDIVESDAGINSTWNALYEGVNYANNLLANINKPEMDETRRNVIKGETLFLRAYMYFKLVTMWGDVPMLLEPTTDSRKVNNPVTPSKDIYAQILNDMKEAKDLVNDYNTNGTPIHVSKTAVEGMLARVCLKMAGEPLKDVSKYTEARAWADSVIQSHIHSLNPDYKQIFINECADLFDNAHKEVLWEIDFYGNNMGGKAIGGRWAKVMAVRNTNKDIYSEGFLGATPYLYNLYGAGDLRRDAAIQPYSIYKNNGTIPLVIAPTDIYSRSGTKWPREYEDVQPLSTVYSPTNYPILRYADVLLMFAEADNEINGATSQAYDALNAVRRRGYGLPVTTPVDSVSVLSRIDLSTTGNTGYLTTVNSIPVTISGGGGTGATAIASVSPANGKVNAVAVTKPGSGYTSAPTITLGTAWHPNTSYQPNTQVFYGKNLYTVTGSGTSTDVPPSQNTGASDPNVTGATFKYAGLTATGTATIATSNVDVSNLSPAAFRDTIRSERARELCYEGLRKFDLIRWGIFIPRMKEMETYLTAVMPASLKYVIKGYTNVSEKYKLFPIPLKELSLNSALQQNPLWK
jgi:starch-binding outer membrane protein, SusD/RagB family